MTIQEKFKKIKEWCDMFDENTCKFYPLSDTKFSNGGICYEVSTSDNDIEAMYYTLFHNKEDVDIKKKYDILFGDNEVNDPINPAHYKDGKIEVIEFIEDKKLGYCLGNAVKYIARAGKKDPTKEIEDLKKAEWYVKRRIKELEEVG